MANPLIDERTLAFILDECLKVGELTSRPYYAMHNRETMAMSVEAARGLVYRAMAMADTNDPDLTRMASMAKCFAGDVAMKVTTDAGQLLGGHGFTKDFPVERMFRDAKITQIYEGTNQIQRMVVARKTFTGVR